MGAKILSVDDSKTIRLIINRAFKPYDCTVLEAATGLEGMAIATREKPDVIILDVTMPIMDGMEMLSTLRANHALRNIPVVMLTAEAGRETVLRIAKMGVRDYLIKPFKEEQIIERVSRIVPLEAAVSAGKSKKRFDDPISILLVDDKAAILEQIRAGLSDTPWKIEGASEAHTGLIAIEGSSPDVILISTSLPESTGFWLLEKLRTGVKTQRMPIFAVTVKNALAEQARAQQVGFTGIITKPIDYADLKTKVARILKLDSSYRYFAQRDGFLWLQIPELVSAFDHNEIATNLSKKTSDAVDSGLGKMIIDLRQLKRIDVALIELCISVVKIARDLSMRVDFLGNPAVQVGLNGFHETKGWVLYGSIDEIRSDGAGSVIPADSEPAPESSAAAEDPKE